MADTGPAPTATELPHKKRPELAKPRLRKVDRPARLAEVQRLRTQGLTYKQIGAIVGVGHEQVYKYLSDFKPYHREIKRFQTHRADFFDSLAMETLDLQLLVLRKLKERLNVSGKEGFTIWHLVELIQKTAMSSDILFKNQRLERGESTENISQVTKILETVHQRRQAIAVYPTPVQGEPAPTTP